MKYIFGKKEFYRLVVKRLDDIDCALATLSNQIEDVENHIMGTFEDMQIVIQQLTDQVAQTHGVVQSAVVLLTSLADKIDQYANDPAALAALANQLRTDTGELSAAVALIPPEPPAP